MHLICSQNSGSVLSCMSVMCIFFFFRPALGGSTISRGFVFFSQALNVCAFCAVSGRHSCLLFIYSLCMPDHKRKFCGDAVSRAACVCGNKKQKNKNKTILFSNYFHDFAACLHFIHKALISNSMLFGLFSFQRLDKSLCSELPYP